jgi:hypothetical protein
LVDAHVFFSQDSEPWLHLKNETFIFACPAHCAWSLGTPNEYEYIPLWYNHVLVIPRCTFLKYVVACTMSWLTFLALAGCIYIWIRTEPDAYTSKWILHPSKRTLLTKMESWLHASIGSHGI